MTGMLGGDLAERAVVVDDPQMVVATLGVRRETVRRQRVGDGLDRRAERPMAGGQFVAGESGGHRPAVLGADLFGHLFRLVVGKAGQRPSEQRQDEVVAAHREVGERAGGGGVALRRPPGAATGETAGRDLEIPAGGELVEVVTGDVGMDADLGRPPSTVVTPSSHT